MNAEEFAQTVETIFYRAETWPGLRLQVSDVDLHPQWIRDTYSGSLPAADEEFYATRLAKLESKAPVVEAIATSLYEYNGTGGVVNSVTSRISGSRATRADISDQLAETLQSEYEEFVATVRQRYATHLYGEDETRAID